MNALTKTERDATISKVVATVERKHFDPHFPAAHLSAAVEDGSAEILAADVGGFEAPLNDLVRSMGTPDSGFFHESSRK